MRKLLLLLSLLCFRSELYSFEISSEGKFLNFSDIHFDPYYDSTLVLNLLNSDFEKWESVFQSSEIKTLSTYGSDCNFNLLESSLNEMSKQIPDPDFIIINGDFMSHKFNENFKHFTGIENTDTLNLFIEKTIRFIASMITKHYPETFIYPVLGNDDSYCGNYMVEPESKFLTMFSDTWEPMVNRNSENTTFKKDFSKGGYSLVNFPGNEDTKLILLNTVFFSPKYKNLCGDTTADPGKEELEWLSDLLRSVKQNNQKVYLSYHIPPGIDIFATIHGKGNCEEKIYSSWKPEYNDKFIKIVNEYSSVITAQFAGHFHRDDYRLFYNENSPVSFLHITPSVSPIYGSNPSFQIISYDKTNYELTDYETFNLNYSTILGKSYWKAEYNFQKSYSQNSYSMNSLDNVYKLVNSDSSVREKYLSFYTSENRKMFTEDIVNWKYYWCGIKNLTKENYSDCFCNQD